MKLTTLSRLLLIAASALLFASVFMAIWRIELAAPQYPEGLVLLIFANKLGGDVDIINGLNHYIGMQTLHTENFIEFTLLPYLISFFALYALVVAIFANKKSLYVLFTSFVFFGVIAMVDFYRWNYNYGHNLDPHAAIVVPGMAYQPPLIGYKQLLNFGAFSVPDKGGWLFISAGLLMLMAVILTYRKAKSKKTNFVTAAASICLVFFLSSCMTPHPKPVKINKDNCDFCKMTISDAKFVAQAITKKGRYYFFDDISCMIKFKRGNNQLNYAGFYIADFANPKHYMPTDSAILLKNEEITSPMGGNIVAFANHIDANEFVQQHHATVVIWPDLIK